MRDNPRRFDKPLIYYLSVAAMYPNIGDQGGDGENAEDLEKPIHEEIPLGHKNTGRSLASELIEQKRIIVEAGKVKFSHSLFNLFKRMGVIMRDHWSKYLIGSIAACGIFLLRYLFCPSIR